MRKLNIILFVVSLLAIVGLSVYKWYDITFEEYTACKTATTTYTLDAEYEKVKRVMIRGNVLEEMVEAEQGELLEKQWSNLILSSEKLRAGFQIDGRGNFTIKTDDPEMGSLVLRFGQTVHIGADQIYIHTKLKEPVGYLKNIEVVMIMKPDETQTMVETKATVTYKRRVPQKYFKQIADTVTSSAQRIVAKNQEVITRLVLLYKDKKFIIPFAEITER